MLKMMFYHELFQLFHNMISESSLFKRYQRSSPVFPAKMNGATRLLSDFERSSVKFESPRCTTINDLLWVKDNVSPIIPPLSNPFGLSPSFGTTSSLPGEEAIPALCEAYESVLPQTRSFESVAIAPRPGSRSQRPTSNNSPQQRNEE